MDTSSGLAQFGNQPYLNLETVRKSGVAVATPVWFINEGDTIYVRTPINSGKVKRIRNNPHVRIAPCERRGKLLGAWVSGNAQLTAAADVDRIGKLMNARYGTAKKIVDFVAGLRHLQYVVIAIQAA